jgi:hypothetical protein
MHQLKTQGVAKRENYTKMYSRPQKGFDKNSLEVSKKYEQHQNRNLVFGYENRIKTTKHYTSHTFQHETIN